MGGSAIERQEAEALFALAYRVAYRLLGQRPDAEDIAQETVARAVVHWSRIATYAEPWTARVATNLALDVIRRRRRSAPPAEVSTSDDHAEERLDLAQAIAKLPRRQREVVVLRYLADRSEADVAELLGCTVGTVKQHAHRALNALRTDLLDPLEPA